MTAEEIALFKKASVVRVVVDPVTQERVICHVHPDGRVLVDAASGNRTTSDPVKP
jgi:hypothetical protein